MDRMLRFIRLDHLHSKLAAHDWETLNLKYLEPLRFEVAMERERILAEDRANADSKGNKEQ